MEIKKIDQICDFLNTVDSCSDGVWLMPPCGDIYNLKSQPTQYSVIAALLGTEGDTLELWCDNKEDEVKFFKFFQEHPEV